MKCVLIVYGLVQVASAWHVLIVNVFVGGSHQTVSKYTANLLAARGHNVTYVSTNIPTLSLHPNITLITLSQVEETGNALLETAIVRLGRFGDTISEKYGLIKRLLSLCGMFYEDPNIKEMIASSPKYDAMITMGMIYDACALGLAHELGIAVRILHIPTPFFAPYHVSNLGLPLYISSVNTHGTLFSSTANYSVYTRSLNLVKRALITMLLDFIQRVYIEPDIRAHVTGYPGYNTVLSEVDLILLAHHPVADHPVPFGPGVVSVAGSLCKDLNPADFSPELLSFLDKGEFVFLSFGSHIKNVSKVEQQIIIDALEIIPYNVVWKANSEITNLPLNVRTWSWVPQVSLLRHPNIRAFITHGGYASKIEAFCGGVPLLMVPKIAPDQFEHATEVVSRGLGDAVLQLDRYSSEQLYEKIMYVSTNSEVRKKCKVLQRQLLATRVTEEQVLGYIDVAISGHKLLPGYQPFWEYFYLDIIAIPVAVIAGIRYFLTKIRR